MKFKKGDAVVMHSCGEADHEKGKVWICYDDSFVSPANDEVVFLKGYSGFFVCKYLQKVDIKTINPWISVDERLPEPQNFCRPTDFIRFICSDGYVYDGFYYRHYGEDGEFDEGFNVCSLLAENGKWCVDEREILHSGDTITHWQPLPEPPEGD